MLARVLCVEDNPQNMRLVRKILTGAGYEVLEAVNGTEAIQVVQQQQLDLVLMDVNLPDIDGLEVTRRIRQIPAFSALPIVALTANAMHGDKERCLAAGCTGYIPKPITKVELLTTVAQTIRQVARARVTSELNAIVVPDADAHPLHQAITFELPKTSDETAAVPDSAVPDKAVPG